MKKECNILRQSSLYVRNWTNTQPNVKEESLTDWLLFNVSEKTKNITYRDFTRHEESKTTGADWEWWFIFPNFSYKFRVQAKKTKTSSIYAFYTDKIDRVKCKKRILDEGVYLVSAIDLKNKFVIPNTKKIEYNDILEDTIPLSCLLCCELHNDSKNEKPENFEVFVKEYFYSSPLIGNESIENLGKYKQTPNYVNSLLEFSNKDLPDWWEKEFGRNIEDLNGILVFDRR